MADAQAVEASQKFFEQVQKLLEDKSTSEAKQLEVLNAILTKAGFIEHRVESLQKLRRDQFRHLVQILLEFDDLLGGTYGFLSSIKDIFGHCQFENDSDQKVFLWAAQLKARGEKLYAVFDVERQIVQAK